MLGGAHKDGVQNDTEGGQHDDTELGARASNAPLYSVPTVETRGDSRFPLTKGAAGACCGSAELRLVLPISAEAPRYRSLHVHWPGDLGKG